MKDMKDTLVQGAMRKSLALSAAGVFVPVRRTLADLDKADDDDESECQQLRRGKEVLHSGGRLHTVAVHKRQKDCRDRTIGETLSGFNSTSATIDNM